jgi:CBS domain-containing protein
VLVEDVMTEEVVTCSFGASLQTAAERMLSAGVGSVVVRRAGDPVGIVTETDALHAGAATGEPFTEIPVSEVLSHPLVTIGGDATVRRAVERMKDEDVKKLPVVEDLDLRGIVTRTDVLFHFGESIREAHALDARRDRWQSRDWEL